MQMHITGCEEFVLQAWAPAAGRREEGARTPPGGRRTHREEVVGGEGSSRKVQHQEEGPEEAVGV